MKNLKLLAVLCIVFILFTTSTTIALAENNNSVTFEVCDVAIEGGYADVVVKITENSGMAGFTLKLSYDHKLLELQSVTKGAVLKQGLFVNSSNDPNAGSPNGCETIFWSNASNVSSTGDAFTVRFSLTGVFFTQTPITLSYTVGDIADQYYNDLAVTLIDGTVTATEDCFESYNPLMPYTLSFTEFDPSLSKFKASVKIMENIVRDANDYLIIAVYRDNMLYDILKVAPTLSPGENTYVSSNLYGGEGAVVKAFIWNSLTGMTSLSNAATR